MANLKFIIIILPRPSLTVISFLVCNLLLVIWLA